MTNPIRITPTRSGKFRVKYYAANGEMLAHSEVLNSKQSCRKNIEAMKRVFYDERMKEIVAATGIKGRDIIVSKPVKKSK